MISKLFEDCEVMLAIVAIYKITLFVLIGAMKGVLCICQFLLFWIFCFNVVHFMIKSIGFSSLLALGFSYVFIDTFVLLFLLDPDVLLCIFRLYVVPIAFSYSFLTKWIIKNQTMKKIQVSIFTFLAFCSATNPRTIAWNFVSNWTIQKLENRST